MPAVNPIFKLFGNAFTGFSRQRENLDSKLVAFSMLALCKKMLGQ
jgi:hypothetical protein